MLGGRGGAGGNAVSGTELCLTKMLRQENICKSVSQIAAVSCRWTSHGDKNVNIGVVELSKN